MESFDTPEKEKIKIRKVHFLIHPGFGMPAFLAGQEGAEAKYESLLKKYVENAKSLGSDELLFAFPYTDRSRLKSGLKREDFSRVLLREMKKILGKRLVVLNDDGEITNAKNAAASFLKMEKLAKARGFVFDADVESEAYGEALYACVKNAANALNEVGHFSQKTVLLPELTPISLQKPLSEVDKKILRSDKVDIK